METTRLSTKGQIVLPKSLLDNRAWGPGTEFTIEETGDGVLLRLAGDFPATDLDEVAGCLRYQGKPKSLSEMDKAIGRQVGRRHDGGRY